ncbi:MAG TPA: D-sedoheptulose 7-phosphate isomerase [Acidobacteriota bacterium]|nr:D-sedoheptulose 7-phosphate isomerase [Acidobacteriota bacterium]
MIETIRNAVSDSVELKKSFFVANEHCISLVAREICAAFERGSKILLYGNGGSAADAQHIAAEWVGRFQCERRPLPAIALTTNTSILTCIGNDYGYEQIFLRQVRAFGRPNDIAVAISTSGNSPNVLAATEAAREIGLATIGLTGGDGGKLGSMVQYHLNVPHKSTARVQEIHIMICHILCELVDENLKGS